ncbi:3-hydroxyisobutyrate dehydrogenase [Altererythrobacter insulae]|nr:3-hydroxyisobutyrate dehydrogenase [Altererythrobacter insulae]
MFESFQDIREDIAERLSAASTNRKLPMQTPVVATADADARVMVLRAFDTDAWTLRFHTDLRSPKCAVIADAAPVGVLFYDKPEKVQIRVRGVGRIEHDTPLADQAWAESTNFAKRCYLGDGPGAVSDVASSGLPDWAEGIQPTDEQVEPARENFAILLVELKELDWFYLANSGHIRAQFSRDGYEWHGRWVTP